MNLPYRRRYIKGDRITCSIRLTKELLIKLKKIASERGHPFSNFVQDGLDQWAYAHDKSKD